MFLVLSSHIALSAFRRRNFLPPSAASMKTWNRSACFTFIKFFTLFDIIMPLTAAFNDLTLSFYSSFAADLEL